MFAEMKYRRCRCFLQKYVYKYIPKHLFLPKIKVSPVNNHLNTAYLILPILNIRYLRKNLIKYT